MDNDWKPRYSGPNRSGICVCGCSWEDHHLSIVMKKECVEATGEIYIPDECCRYGSNEMGGRQYVNGEWIDHCHGYRDSKE